MIICVIIVLFYAILSPPYHFNGVKFDAFLLAYVIFFFSDCVTLGEANTHNLN